MFYDCCKYKNIDSGGIRTHATEVTGALNQRLRPLGHAILYYQLTKSAVWSAVSLLRSRETAEM